MTNPMLIVIGMSLVAIVFVLASQTFKLIFAYKLMDDRIVVFLFHVLPIYVIPFHKIDRMREAALYEVAAVPGMHLFTRPFGSRVVIEMRDRWARFAFLTPSNPGAFIADIKRRMTRS
jgi:hypothetical protein